MCIHFFCCSFSGYMGDVNPRLTKCGCRWCPPLVPPTRDRPMVGSAPPGPSLLVTAGRWLCLCSSRQRCLHVQRKAPQLPPVRLSRAPVRGMQGGRAASAREHLRPSLPACGCASACVSVRSPYSQQHTCGYCSFACCEFLVHLLTLVTDFSSFYGK